MMRFVALPSAAAGLAACGLVVCWMAVGLGLGCASAHAEARVLRDVPYVAGAGPEQVLDVFAPAQRGPALQPVLVFVHGGAWILGDKRRASSRASFYTDRGVVFVSVNYRLAPGAVHPAQIRDCDAAVRWVLDHIEEHGGDPDRVVLSGHSAGAHLVALVGTHRGHAEQAGLDVARLAAIVAVDTASFDLTADQEGFGSRIVNRSKREAFGDAPDTLRDASPVHQVTEAASLPPFELFVTAGRPAAVAETRRFAEVLRANGHRANAYVLDESMSHRDMNLAIYEEGSAISAKILEWLDPGRAPGPGQASR